MGLAILPFVVAAVLVFFAFQPKLAFFLDEGWKFRQKTAPSELYIGVSVVGRLMAGVAAAVKSAKSAGATASSAHCRVRLRSRPARTDWRAHL